MRITLPDVRAIGPAARAALRAVGAQAVAIIRERTARGVGSDGAAFKEYSPGYALAKAGTGRGSRPDLTFTGAMLGNLKVKAVTESSVVIGFEGQHRAQAIVSLRRKPRVAVHAIGPQKFRKTHHAAKVAATVPMAIVVRASDRLRPFFRIESKTEIAQLVKTFEEVFAREMKARRGAGR